MPQLDLCVLDMSVTKFTDLVSSGAGGILLLLPSIDSMQKLSEENRESINLLQDHLHTTEFEIPIYFAEESPELLELMESLGGETGGEKKASAFESKYFHKIQIVTVLVKLKIVHFLSIILKHL